MQHKFKKQFGQNFISDANLLKAIVSDAKVEKTDQVLEIGAGEGALTKYLSAAAQKVVSYEIDLSLESCLLGLGLENVKFVFKDALKEPMDKIEEDFDGDYKIVANLSYYITTPLIFKFLSQSKRVKSMTIMVQKEVGQRIVAKPGGKDYGVLSLMCQFYATPKITRIVGKQMFFPQPKVDSALVCLEINKQQKADGEEFYNFVKKCFSMRRKTLINNLQGYSGLSKSELAAKLPEFDLNLRPEQFSLEQYLLMLKKIGH